MRILKSLMLLLTLFCTTFIKAQDTTIVEDTIFVTGKKDTAAIFHADKPTGLLQWNERNVPETTLQHLRRDEAFWYANAEFKKKKAAEREPSSFNSLFRQQWFYYLLWTIIISACVAVMLLFFMKSNLSFFRKTPATVAGSSNAEISENIFSINYDNELKSALAQKDFRLAVRLHFLQALLLLATKNVIQFQEGLTNSDYLQQLRQTAYYASFKKLTHHFEYAWYGHFLISAELYSSIETDFTTFKNDMGI